jgi:ecdysone receptor
MDMYMRRKCQECRLKKCLAVGMRPECVVPENQCAIKRKEKKAQKEKDKVTTGTAIPSSSQNNALSIVRPSNRINNAFKNEVLPQLMKCDPPPHAVLQALLPDKLLLENKAKNIPQLSANQMAVIYKLIWYQDGYEQPSEEDLKRIMNVSFIRFIQVKFLFIYIIIFIIHRARETMKRIRAMFISGI